MIRPHFVAVYIATRKGEEPLYLLLRRSLASYLPGIWQIVTGKLHEGEEAGSAVQREIFEETGIVSSELYHVDVTLFYEQIKNRIAFSANFCAIVEDTSAVVLSPAEHDAYQWCTFSEARSHLAFPSQKETLSLIHKHYVLETVHKPASVVFGVLLNHFSIFFAGVISTFIYNPRKKNRKLAKITPKNDEAWVRGQSLRKTKFS